MVAAIPPSPTAAATPSPKNPNTSQQQQQQGDHSHSNPSRVPLVPSEKSNAGAHSRRSRSKDVSSRYLLSSTSSQSTSTSTSTTATTSSSSSSSSRRFPSPLVSSRAVPQSPALLNPKRSHSVDRTRHAATSKSDPARPTANGNAAPSEISSAARALCTTTRSLSVSFQGESFFYQTSKAKAATPNPSSRKAATPERRRTASTQSRNGRVDGGGGGGGDQAENSRPVDLHRWPTARTKQSNPLMRSLDCTLDRKDSIFGSIRLMQQSMILDEGRRASFDAGDLSMSSDSDSVSSGSNSGAQEAPSAPARSLIPPRGFSMSSRFWQDTNSRLRRLPEPGTPLSPSFPKAVAAQKLVPLKVSLNDSPRSSPRSASSPLRGPIRPPSPSKAVSASSRALSSPSRMRNTSSLVDSSPIGQPGLAPSILTFAAEIRRAKKGENRIEEAHLLRLLNNWHLQWRCVNARTSAALMMQKVTAEKNLYNAWVATAELCNSVAIKKIKLQLLTHNLKLTSILKGQMTYLEEWSHMEKDYSGSLSGAIEALKASTVRLPVVCGARADIQDVKEAVCSAVDVMQAMGSSICSLLSKAEGTSSVMSELAKTAAQEQYLLNQAKDLLSSVAAIHVRHSSLRGQILQLKCNPRRAKQS